MCWYGCNVSAFKHFDPHRRHFIVANSCVHTWQPIVDGYLPHSFLQTPKNCTIACFLTLVKTSSVTTAFKPFSLVINGLQLNHTYSMSRLTLGYCISKSQQCSQYNENIRILPSLFDFVYHSHAIFITHIPVKLFIHLRALAFGRLFCVSKTINFGRLKELTHAMIERK